MATPFSMRHYLPTAITGISYVSLNYVISKFGEPAYKILSWDDSKTAILIIGAGVFSFITHMILVLISKRKINKFRSEDQIQESNQD